MKKEIYLKELQVKSMTINAYAISILQKLGWKCQLGNNAFINISRNNWEYSLYIPTDEPLEQIEYKLISHYTDRPRETMYFNTCVSFLGIPDTLTTWYNTHGGLNIIEKLNSLSVLDMSYLKAGTKDITLPPHLKVIIKSYRSGVKSNINLTLNNELEYLDDFSFALTGIKEVRIPNSIKYIGNSVFYSCEDLLSIDTGSALEEIPQSFAQGCIKLEELIVNAEIKKIEKYAFFGCSSLEKVSIPRDCTYIGSYAFGNCTSLESVSLPEGLKYIGSNAFSNTNIRVIKIPKSVDCIEENAFKNTRIQKVILHKEFKNVFDKDVNILYT